MGQKLQEIYTFIIEILMQETSLVFAGALEDAGIYKSNDAGRAGLSHFVEYVNQITY